MPLLPGKGVSGPLNPLKQDKSAGESSGFDEALKRGGLVQIKAGTWQLLDLRGQESALEWGGRPGCAWTHPMVAMERTGPVVKGSL